VMEVLCALLRDKFAYLPGPALPTGTARPAEVLAVMNVIRRSIPVVGEGYSPDHFRLNLSGCDLRRVDLKGANLRGAILRHCLMTGAQLQNAILDGADLSHSAIDDANLSNTSINGAKIDSIYAVRCVFNESCISNVADNSSSSDFSWAKFNKVVFFNSRFQAPNFFYTDFNDAKFLKCSFTGTRFSGSLSGSLFYKTSFMSGSFDAAYLPNLKFYDVQFIWGGEPSEEQLKQIAGTASGVGPKNNPYLVTPGKKDRLAQFLFTLNQERRSMRGFWQFILGGILLFFRKNQK